MADLNHRARKILSAVVHEYLATGDAVGSRTVPRRYGIDLSPATVRNVMSDLEEAGLLKQPHTSAGRVPTDQGLRFFVDSLLEVRSLSDKERLRPPPALPDLGRRHRARAARRRQRARRSVDAHRGPHDPAPRDRRPRARRVHAP